jgi:hypothetical protein
VIRGSDERWCSMSPGTGEEDGMDEYKAYQGANGWYVALEQHDGFHHQPPCPRWLEEGEARAQAARENDAALEFELELELE